MFGITLTSETEFTPAMDRRRVVVALIVLAVAVPLLVEGFTLVGLVMDAVGGEDGTPTGTAADTSGGTSTGSATTGAAPGDELLPETARNETLSTATLRAGDRWTLTITVVVTNTGDTPYELRLGSVGFDERSPVSGSATTGRIEPGETATVSAQWSLPSGASPDRLVVAAFEYGENGARTVVDRDVDLADIPVRG